MKLRPGPTLRDPLSTYRGAHLMLGRLVAEAMEPRILHSADVSPLAAAFSADALAGAWTDAPYQRLVSDAASTSQGGQEIAFVDMALPDAQQLVDDLLAQSAAGRPLEVVRIEAGSDGVAVITATLEGRSNLSAVHVLSHAQDGRLQLGATGLDGTSLLLRSGEVASWGQALSADADLLLYGCDVAATDTGRALLVDLAALTGADVAASTDTTGAVRLGGDWTLEYALGDIEAVTALSAVAQQAWSGTLAITDTGASSAATAGAQTSLSFTHSVAPGANGLLVVQVMTGNAEPVTSVSFNGIALTPLSFATSSGNEVRAEFWILKAPPVTSASVVVTTAASTQIVAGATSFAGVDQTTPTGAVFYNKSNDAAPTLTLASSAGERVLDVAGAVRVTGYTVGPGQTQAWSNTNGNGNGDVWAVSSTEPGAASVTMSHSFTSVGGASDKWVSLATTIKPAGRPTITSNGGGDSAAIGVTENTTSVTTVTATDADGPALTYSIVGGADAARFDIVAATGVLSFKTAPDFEAPLDSGGNNVYDVVVRASDGTLWDEQALAVSVTDVGNTLTVTTTADVVNGNTGSIELLVANPGADGLISLREAIIAANNTAGADTIVLPAGTYTIGILGAGDDLSASGDFDIRDSLTILGAGAAGTAISGGHVDGVLEIVAGSVSLSGLTVRDGFTSFSGAGIEVKSGANLTLDQVVVRDNWSTGGDGGGISNQGALTVTNSEIRGNYAWSDGGGIYHTGTSLTLDRVTVAENAAWQGAGIYDDGASMALTNVTLSSNVAGHRGGALFITEDAALLNVTLANNAAFQGGGLYANDSEPLVTLRNVLLAGNVGGNIRQVGGVTSLGNNLSDTATPELDQASDQVAASANLGALADNGGFGRTHALLDGSAAIDAGDTAAAPPTDQRGTARLGGADIGAYEAAVGVNRMPLNTVPGAQSVLEDTSAAIAGLSVNDPDQGNGIALHELSTTTLSVSNGALQVTLAAGATISAGANGSATLTLAGSQADINATLATLRYQGNANYVGGDTLVMVSRDGAGLTDSDNLAITVTGVNDAPTGAPVITGTPTENQTLGADTSAIGDADGLGVFSYQWTRNGAAIAGATASTYTLGDADVGTQIRVVVGYTDGGGTAENLTSAAAGPVANVNDAPTGAPVVTGTPTENQTLSADTSAIGDADGLGTFSYQWTRNGAAIAGATASTYTLGDADVGTLIRVVVGYSDGGGTAESLTSAAAGPVANVNDAPSGSVTIDDTTPAQGQALTASHTLSDADGLGLISYQWQRNGVDIAGATGTTYTTTQADVGQMLRVIASYTDGQGTLESVASADTGAVANVNDAPTGAPVVTGTPTENQTLSADTSAIADADGLGTFSYQWTRNGAAIAGATASTYTLGDADVGTLIRVVVGYTDGGGTAENLTSVAAGPVANVNDAPSGAPVVTGTPTENQTLSADTSAIADADGLGVFSYQWTRNGAAIAGATASTYTLGDADVGTQIRVVVGYTDGGGTAESLTSAAAGPVANVNDAPSGAPVVTGTPTENQTLSADTSAIADADGLGAFSYQWTRNGAAIAGATASTYTLGDADVGTLIRVVVGYTDGGGTAENLTSAALGPVAGVDDEPNAAALTTGMPTPQTPTSTATSSASSAPPPAAASQPVADRRGDAVGTTTSGNLLQDASATSVDDAMRTGVTRAQPSVGVGATVVSVPDRLADLQRPPSTFEPETFDAAMPQFVSANSLWLSRLNLAGSAEATSWARAFESMRDQVTHSTEVHSTQVAYGATLSVGVSVGYVMWMLRGGLLLSSVLAALPAWQLMDPLPLLARSRLRDEDRSAPDDDVEQVFDEGDEKPSPRKRSGDDGASPRSDGSHDA